MIYVQSSNFNLLRSLEARRVAAIEARWNKLKFEL